MGWLIFAGYVVSCVAAFALLVRAWRYDLDVTRRGAMCHAILSLCGPASLIAAVIIWQISRPKPESRVLWACKP